MVRVVGTFVASMALTVHIIPALKLNLTFLLHSNSHRPLAGVARLATRINHGNFALTQVRIAPGLCSHHSRTKDTKNNYMWSMKVYPHQLFTDCHQCNDQRLHQRMVTAADGHFKGDRVLQGGTTWLLYCEPYLETITLNEKIRRKNKPRV